LSTVDHETPVRPTVSTKARAPSPPTVRVGHHRLDTHGVTQALNTIPINPVQTSAVSIHDTVRSTVSTGSFDYLRGPRRCILKVDRNKGLGFVLSATGDYDHTITAVEKVRSSIETHHMLSNHSTSIMCVHCFICSIQQLILLVYKLTMKY
jgi:hypothetical protein